MVSGNTVGRSFLQENLNADVVGTRVPTTIGQIVRAFIEALSEKNAENVEDHTYIYIRIGSPITHPKEMMLWSSLMNRLNREFINVLEENNRSLSGGRQEGAVVFIKKNR